MINLTLIISQRYIDHLFQNPNGDIWPVGWKLLVFGSQKLFGTLDQAWGIFHSRSPRYPRQKAENSFPAFSYSTRVGWCTNSGSWQADTCPWTLIQEGDVAALGGRRLRPEGGSEGGRRRSGIFLGAILYDLGVCSCVAASSSIFLALPAFR